GKGEAFSPTDLVAGALASCLMTIMGIEANKMSISLDGLSTDTQKLMSPPPRRIAKLRISVQWPNPTASAEQIELLKQKALTCPVALSLHPDITQEITFNF
ncbi:MAG: putative OsmC-like protein, partial [Cyclobacteriaceae bacterium]